MSEFGLRAQLERFVEEARERLDALGSCVAGAGFSVPVSADAADQLGREGFPRKLWFSPDPGLVPAGGPLATFCRLVSQESTRSRYEQAAWHEALRSLARAVAAVGERGGLDPAGVRDLTEATTAANEFYDRLLVAYSKALSYAESALAELDEVERAEVAS